MKQSLCEGCGKLYHVEHYGQKYCSMQCSRNNKTYYLNQREVQKTCIACGKEYPSIKKKQKYCSEKCRREYNRTRIAESRINNPPAFLKLRFEIFKRDKFRCRYCGRGVADGVILEIDHLIPKKERGSNGIDNFITACGECNRGKSDILLLANKGGQLPMTISI